MLTQDLSIDPVIGPGLAFHRELSKAATARDMMFIAARGLAEVTGATHLVLACPADGDARRREVQLAVSLNDPKLTPDAFDERQVTARPRAIVSGTPLDELIGAGTAKVAYGVPVQDDPILRRAVAGATTALVVPLAFGGVVSEWAMLWWPAGTEISPADARHAIGSLNLLARSIEQMSLHEEIRELNERLDAEVKSVAAVQRSILPDRAPELAGWDIASHYEPCEAAGGDYFDFRMFPDGRLGVVVADVAGHGAGAAVVMAMLRTAMVAESLANADAESVVRYVNRIMYDGVEPGMFVTALFVVIDPATGVCGHASAGHHGPRIVRVDGGIESPELNACIPLGIAPDTDAGGEPRPFVLERGDRMLMYTDGLIEARSPSGALFGLDRLDAALAAGERGESSRATLDRVMRAVAAFEGGTPRADDQCAVVVRRTDG